jgi:hypothetical protein
MLGITLTPRRQPERYTTCPAITRVSAMHGHSP